MLSVEFSRVHLADGKRLLLLKGPQQDYVRRMNSNLLTAVGALAAVVALPLMALNIWAVFRVDDKAQGRARKARMEADLRESENRRLADERAAETERRAIEREEAEQQQAHRLLNERLNSEINYYIDISREILGVVTNGLNARSNSAFLELQDLYRKLNVFVIRESDVETVQLIQRLRLSIAPKIMREHEYSDRSWQEYLASLKLTVFGIIQGLESKRRS